MRYHNASVQPIDAETLLAPDLLTLLFNLFYSLVNPRDPQRDFFLLLLQLL